MNKVVTVGFYTTMLAIVFLAIMNWIAENDVRLCEQGGHSHGTCIAELER